MTARGCSAPSGEPTPQPTRPSAPSTDARRPRTLAWHEHATVAAIAVGVLLLVALTSDVPLCPVALLTGLPCPSCGLSRATLCLLRGEWSAALGHHPLSPVAAPLVGLALLHELWGSVAASRQAPRPLSIVGRRLLALGAGTLLLLMVGVWLARFLGYFGGPVAVEGPFWR